MQAVYHLVVKLIGIACASYLATLALVTSVFAADPEPQSIIGTIGYTRGVVVVRASEKSVRLVKVGSPIHTGELIMTGEGSYVEITFTDKSKIVIRPNSQFVIEDYHYDPATPDKDVFKARLLQGGYRGYSGSIGKRYNPDSYRVDTHVAYIGIRGTVYAAYYCKQDTKCQNDLAAANNKKGEKGLKYKSGLYMTVRDGSVVMASETHNSLQRYEVGGTGYTSQAASGSVLEILSDSPPGLDFVVPDNPEGCVVN